MNETEMGIPISIIGGVVGGVFESGVMMSIVPMRLAEWRTPISTRRKPWSYFVTDGEFVKIGCSARPLDRMRDLQVSTPKDLRLVAVSDVYELSLHDLFHSLHVRGEWFEWRCGSILRWLEHQWLDKYGDNSPLDFFAVSNNIGISAPKLRSICQPYGCTIGGLRLALDERCNVRSGMRIFSPDCV